MTVPNEVSDPLIGLIKQYKYTIAIVIACVITAYASVYFFGKNNPIEIEIEKVVEAEIGLHIDFTP